MRRRRKIPPVRDPALDEFRPVTIAGLRRDGAVVGYVKIWTETWVYESGPFWRRKRSPPVEQPSWIAKWLYDTSDYPYSDWDVLDPAPFVADFNNHIFRCEGDVFEVERLAPEEMQRVSREVFLDGTDEYWGPSLPKPE